MRRRFRTLAAAKGVVLQRYIHKKELVYGVGYLVLSALVGFTKLKCICDFSLVCTTLDGFYVGCVPLLHEFTKLKHRIHLFAILQTSVRDKIVFLIFAA